MNTFLNYNVNTGISFGTSREPNATSCGDDFQDWALDVSKGEYDSTVSCEDLQTAIDCLEDDSIWHGSDMTIEAMEELHSELKRIQQDQSYTYEDF